MATRKQVYRIRFMNEGKIFELYARKVEPGSIFGFVEVADIVWGSKSEVIVDPTEQELKNEFAGVSRTHVPMHAIVRIDEVEKSSGAKIIPLKSGEQAPQPSGMPIYPPRGRGPGRAK